MPAKAMRWLAERIGEPGPSAPVIAEAAFMVPESNLAGDAHNELVTLVGSDHVLTDPGERLGRAGGLSYLDLLRRRALGELRVPDAVVVPAGSEEVQGVLDACVRHDIGVVPFGGGTSVVGGVNAVRGSKSSVIALDLARLDRLVSVDPISRTAVLQAGVRGSEAERLLAEHGLTLGHVPQSFERATIGGFAATRSAGQASSGYGRFDDMVSGMRVATPRGEWRLGVAPASAAGPDLRQLVMGSEGAFGVVTEVTLRVRPVPSARRYEGYVFDGWERASAAVRELAQRRVAADVTRLSDVDETEVSLALNAGWKTAALRRYLGVRAITEPCLLIVGWEGESRGEFSSRRRKAVAVLKGAGAVRIGRTLGESWRRGRFSGPRQRDVLMNNGICVETLETAAYWSKLETLRAAIREALTDSLGSPIIMCHISHVYETGASLYFTVLVPRDGADPIGQWVRAKEAACQAITGLGTISHHHGVGADHAPYLGAEIGSLGLDVLRAVKATVDPTGVLNPGKLV